MSENNKKEDLKFGLIFFTDTSQKNDFIKDINNVLKNNKYDGEINENIIENNIKKTNIPSWNENKVYYDKNKDKDNIREHKNYRVIFLPINSLIYYVEKNGAINCIDETIKKYNFINFEKKLWKIIYNEKQTYQINIIEYLNKYFKNDILNKENITIVNNVCKDVINKVIDDNTFDFDYFNFYNLFTTIKEVNKNCKLPNYKKAECIDKNNKQSETLYNENVCKNNENKFILLDRKIIDGCEVADIYDKENKLLFHNKKSGELRILSFQIIIGALIMKNREKHKEYLDYLKDKNINDKIDQNFKYVIGIIGNKKEIAQKDKLSLGIVKFILDKHNIELYIDYINIE
jgi:hypothetical protein